MRREGITVAGSLIADTGYEIDQYPKKGNLTRIYNPVNTTGGVNNVLIDLARLDPELPLKVSGLIGDDEKGRFITNTLSRYGNIDLANIVVRGRTAVTYAMTEKIGKQRTFFYDPGNSPEYHVGDINFPALKAKFFLLEYLLALGTLDEEDPVYGTKAAEVLNRAQRQGMKTIIDMVSEESDRYQRIVRPALKYVDYYISNEVEASGVADELLYDENGIMEEKLWEGLEQIRRLGVGEWVVVHAPSGSYGLNCRTGEQVKRDCIKLPPGYIKGTIGAGDAFAAGVIYAAYREADLAEALEAGTRCAVCSLSREDSNSGVTDYKKMMTMKF